MRRGSLAWWLLVGWWWAPACWVGRVLLWLIFWPVGLWRSLRHGAKKDRARARTSPAEIGKGYRYPVDDRWR